MAEMSVAEKMTILGREEVEEKPPTPPSRVLEEHPFGVVSLYISEATCKNMNIEKKIDSENNVHFKVDTKAVKKDIKELEATSDFYPIKDSLMNYHEDYFLLRYITDDRYVCNHNFEFIVILEVREAYEKALQDKIDATKEAQGPRFWTNLGSDMEVDAEIIKNTRDPETWTSSTMECRPFKDPSFDKFMIEQDMGIQAIPNLKDTGTQTKQKVHRNNQMQYQPIIKEAREEREVLSSKEMGDFLFQAKYRYVDALQQNEVFDLFEDEFSHFIDEEYQHEDRVVTSLSEREEQFYKTCTWDEQAEKDYLNFEEECMQKFRNGEHNISSTKSSPPISPSLTSPK